MMQAITILSLSTLVVLSLAEVVRIPLHRAIPQRSHVDAVQRYVRSAGAGTAPLTKFQSDSRYYAIVGFGTPPQIARLIVGTGGNELWVPSVMCHSRACTKRQSFKYDREKSSTFNATEDYLVLEYPQGMMNASGPMSVDTVTVGGLAVKNQRFVESVSTTGVAIMSYDWDGVMGMAGSGEGLVSIFINMISQGLVPHPIFSYYIDKDRFNGELILGGSDPALYIGSLKYTDLLNGEYYWTIPMQSFSMGNTSYCEGNCGGAFIDTGNGMIFGPSSIILQIHENMGGFDSGAAHMVPCDDIPSLPTITFSFGDNQFSLTPDEYIIKESFPGLGLDICLSAFVASDDIKGLWIFGDPFFKSYYVEFDVGNKQIGIAHSKTSNTASQEY